MTREIATDSYFDAEFAQPIPQPQPEMQPKIPPIIFAEPDVLCRILKSLEGEGPTSAAQALRYGLSANVSASHLAEVTWKGVNLIDKTVTIYRTCPSGRTVREMHKMSQAGWDIILQQLATRKSGNNFVFPSSGGALGDEIRKLLSKVLKRAGLKGRGLNFTGLRRSQKLVNLLVNIPEAEELTILASESSQPLDASLMLAPQNKAKPIIFRELRFGDLPVRARTRITKSALVEMSFQVDVHEHQEFWNGVNEGLKWVFGASLAAIKNIAKEGSELTSTAFFNGDVTARELDYLWPTHTSYAVAHINGFGEYVPATENVIQFEGGFHSVVRIIYQIYSEHFQS